MSEQITNMNSENSDYETANDTSIESDESEDNLNELQVEIEESVKEIIEQILSSESKLKLGNNNAINDSNAQTITPAPDTAASNGPISEADLEHFENKGKEKSKAKPGTKSKNKKPKFQLSPRLEYLSRPRKDILDQMIDARLDGSLPEDALDSWNVLPLPTKIPLGDCPIQVTRTRIGTNLFLPPPANDFDLEDENNLLLPFDSYENLHDPYSKGYVRNKHILDHLQHRGYITESQKVTCTLKDINKYRIYQRRILAAEVQKKLRDEDEEFRRKRAEGMEERIKRDMRIYYEKRTQGVMRRWIKNTVASIKDSSVHNQRVRDMKVLNSQIRKQKAQRDRVKAKEVWYEQVYTQHWKKKYDVEEARKLAHLSYAEKDVKVLEKLSKKQEDMRHQKIEKLEEFWRRKSDWQKEWVELGVELEEIRDQERQKNLEVLKQTGHLPILRDLNKKYYSAYDTCKHGRKTSRKYKISDETHTEKPLSEEKLTKSIREEILQKPSSLKIISDDNYKTDVVYENVPSEKQEEEVILAEGNETEDTDKETEVDDVVMKSESDEQQTKLKLVKEEQEDELKQVSEGILGDQRGEIESEEENKEVEPEDREINLKEENEIQALNEEKEIDSKELDKKYELEEGEKDAEKIKSLEKGKEIDSEKSDKRFESEEREKYNNGIKSLEEGKEIEEVENISDPKDGETDTEMIYKQDQIEENEGNETGSEKQNDIQLNEEEVRRMKSEEGEEMTESEERKDETDVEN